MPGQWDRIHREDRRTNTVKIKPRRAIKKELKLRQTRELRG